MRYVQALGLLVGLTLRNPANAERAVEEGCVDVVIEVRGVLRFLEIFPKSFALLCGSVVSPSSVLRTALARCFALHGDQHYRSALQHTIASSFNTAFARVRGHCLSGSVLGMLALHKARGSTSIWHKKGPRVTELRRLKA